MSDKTHSTRYLLGELTDAEQSAFEAAYFGDVRLFEEVSEAEHALVDDYARDRLPPEIRARFEQVYLTGPRRRERVRFAAALTARADLERASPAQPIVSQSAWRWGQSLFGPGLTLRWSLASLLVLAVASGAWFFIESSRTHREPTQVEGATPPVSRPVAPVVPTAPSVSPRPAILALTVGPGVRGVDPRAPVTLVVPAGTEEVQLALSLDDRDYASYRLLLRAIGGAEILRQDGLRPGADRSAVAFTVKLPASRLESGDYMLTLQGARGGEFDDVSQSLFRVVRK
jgi:hypothetical protein